MAGFWKSVLKLAASSKSRGTPSPSRELHERMGIALLALLRPQLSYLGFEIGTVPVTGMFADAAYRGYLYGVAEGVLLAEAAPLTKDNCLDALTATFALVYGEVEGAALARKTFEEIVEKRPAVSVASHWGSSEVRAVYASGGEVRANGFVLGTTHLVTSDPPGGWRLKT